MSDNFVPNGCGHKGGWIKPPCHIFFEASCNKHDIGYHKGGDERDRMNCDANFLRHMMLDTIRKSSRVRWFYQAWAIIYFAAVRNRGGKYFNWT